MDVLDQLEAEVDNLISRNRTLGQERNQLLGEKEVWMREREQLIAEIERILGRIEALRQEDS